MFKYLNSYGSKIQDLKRQLQNSIPYKGVMAERQIKRLKVLYKDERNKHLAGHPKRLSMDDEDIRDVKSAPATNLLHASLASLENMGRRINSQVNKTVNNKKNESPTYDFLEGAIWLGKNLVIIIEELSDYMETFRSKYLREVAIAGQDADLKRNVNRLILLAGSSVTETMGMINRTKNRTKDIVRVIIIISYSL